MQSINGFTKATLLSTFAFGFAVGSFIYFTAYAKAAAQEPAGQVAPAKMVEVKLSEYKIEMPASAAAGSTTFTVTNTGKTVHNFEIEGNGIEKRLGKLAAGETRTLSVELKPGKYEVYCPIPGHKMRGMKLDLTVQ